MTTTSPQEVIERAKGGKGPSASKLLGKEIKDWWIIIMRPLEDYLIQKRVHPNVLTLTSLIVCIISAYLFHRGLILLGGIVMLAGANFDMLDGRVARALDVHSPYGAFLDSCLDRFAEMFIYLGLLSYFRDSWVFYAVFLSLGGSLMISYTRARAESLGVDCEVGIMQRTERIVYIGGGALFNFIVDRVLMAFGAPPGDWLLKLTIVLILLLSYYTTAQRMIYVMKKLTEGSSHP